MNNEGLTRSRATCIEIAGITSIAYNVDIRGKVEFEISDNQS